MSAQIRLNDEQINEQTKRERTKCCLQLLQAQVLISAHLHRLAGDISMNLANTETSTFHL